jgi:DNA-binding MarR family transcriptional regulator
VTDRPDPAAPPDALAALYARPGFKLRRAHQIALSVFLEECRAQEVTTTQYGILVALHERPGLDQIGLAQALGLDRSTTGLVVGLLEARALLTRVQPPEDRRRRLLTLTDAGRQLLASLAAPAERARLRLLAPLTAAETAIFSRLLDKLLDHHDPMVRVKLLRPAALGDVSAAPVEPR